ncbi:MAG: single-stranded DNA-binding protein [Corynebacterium sp.]|uniref:single-stranded DNA-binding protein n=1 Tax=Corynebacterium sp. TaxID=1720 RepID=UPI003F90506C
MITPQYYSGGLVADPELEYSPEGKPRCRFRIGESDSKQVSPGQWENTQSVYWSVTIFGRWAEAAGQLVKGQQIVVKAKPVTSQWEDREGNKRSQNQLTGFEFYIRPDSPNPPQQQSGGWNQQQGSAPPSSGFSGGDEPPF